MQKVLVINPGSTSTKIGLFTEDQWLYKENIDHVTADAITSDTLREQAAIRSAAIITSLQQRGYSIEDVTAIVVRGGIMRPLAGGVYRVNEAMVNDLTTCRYACHASNLGAVLAFPWGEAYGIGVFTVDPVTVDEFIPVARFSGLRGISRLSMSHALNMKAIAHKVATQLAQRYEEMNLIVAHLGSGISVSAHQNGRMIDVNNANNEGPFSLERTGTLPAMAMIELCFRQGLCESEVKSLITSLGGVFSYLGTKDFRAVIAAVVAGDKLALQVVDAMAYQVAKEIGGMATVLCGDVDRIVLTGGMAYADIFVKKIVARICSLAPVIVLPGEEELEALAAGVQRVLRGEEEVKTYEQEPITQEGCQ
ncbi:MAG: butyrate kinase [Firmicutes bacterium]|nr:butyrate kinase [Bacillota bacterium]